MDETNKEQKREGNPNGKKHNPVVNLRQKGTNKGIGHATMSEISKTERMKDKEAHQRALRSK